MGALLRWWQRALADPAQFAGHATDGDMASYYLRKNGLLIEVRVDASTAIGGSDKAQISDVWLESAMSTIMDCEDSVAAVDAEDKVVGLFQLAWPDEG